jgi:hypothetical protein
LLGNGHSKFPEVEHVTSSVAVPNVAPTETLGRNRIGSAAWQSRGMNHATTSKKTNPAARMTRPQLAPATAATPLCAEATPKQAAEPLAASLGGRWALTHAVR